MSSDEDPSDILANLSIVDLTVERVNQLRIEVGKLQSVHHCEDIEMRLEELLHVVRQRKVIYRSLYFILQKYDIFINFYLESVDCTWS